ncbi:hypothetical protein HAX54_001699, partial [Datura stramonium]|nr:hypothetical protein [Datura stramonium]
EEPWITAPVGSHAFWPRCNVEQIRRWRTLGFSLYGGCSCCKTGHTSLDDSTSTELLHDDTFFLESYVKLLHSFQPKPDLEGYMLALMLGLYESVKR